MAIDDKCVPTKDRERSSYANDECHGWHKQTRNIKGARTPSAAMAFNFILEKILTGVSFDNVESTQLSESIERLEFFNGLSSVKLIDITCVSSTKWNVAEADIEETILFENGEVILFENGEAIIFE